jgi:exodeoxyribonuclease-3
MMRELTPEPEKLFTWWSYRSPDWAAANKGRRLDHVWVSPSLAPAMRGFDVVRETRGWDRPSDHAPVVARFDF